MKKLTVALALVATLAACTPETQPTGPGTTPPPTVSASSPSPSPSPSPTPSPQPSPSFTQELTPEQQGALDAVKEYWRVLDLVQISPDEDRQQLLDLYYNTEAGLQDVRRVGDLRRAGIVQTGVIYYHWREIPPAHEADGLLTIQVPVCTDARKSDLVNSSGESILDPDRSGFVEFTFDMVFYNDAWLINSIVGTDAKKC